jgi:transposase
MLTVETIRKIRLARLRQGKSIREIAREYHVSRNTVRKALRSDSTEFVYERTIQPRPRLGPFVEVLEKQLAEDSELPPRRRRSMLLHFEELQRQGYEGGYDAVRRLISTWRTNHAGRPAAYIPLQFPAGDAFQFDWSHEQIELAGMPATVKVAHIRLCHSRMPLVVAYPRESQEMVFDAHDRAHEFFGGLCRRGVYDNMRTAVKRVLRGKHRDFNSRFQQMCSHYLFDPVACTPGAGWEKGQVENQVKFVRGRWFTPRPKVRTLEELNAMLLEGVIGWAKTRAHPEIKDKTIWEVFQQEREHLLRVPRAFDGYAQHEAVASSTSLVTMDRNRYSVPVSAAGRAVQVRLYARRVVVVAGAQVLAELERVFGRNRTVFNPWHYLPALERKPGALRNGAPFQDWPLPECMLRLRTALERHADWDRQFVAVLAQVPRHGLDAVAKACEEALRSRAVSSDVVLNHLARLHEENDHRDHPASIPDRLQLRVEPVADCPRYDTLLTGVHHAA